MASCGICARETCDVPLTRDTTVKYSQGDIYGLHESVYTPIYDILRCTFSELGCGGEALKRTEYSLRDLKSVPTVIKSGRPAVIMEDDDGDDPLGLMVCVTTTYSGEKISDLPRIFRHFSIPIAPNRPAVPTSPDHLCHLHGLPEWGKSNAWLIAWPFRSTATCVDVWTARADGERVPQVLGSGAMKFLTAECRRRWKGWWEMCRADPGLAAVFEAELRKHIHDRKKCSSGGGRSRTSSYDSLATGINSPCWRNTTRSTTTILEEPENDEVSFATLGGEAGEWKAVGKSRARSTYSLPSTARRKRKGDTNTHSIKAIHSQISLTKKPRNVRGVLNFDIFRAERVN